MHMNTLKSDLLIIGAGLAGCRAAIEACAAGADVIICTKGEFGLDAAASWKSANGFQCWGIHPSDTLDVQVHDTLRCGWFLNNQENVYQFLAHVPDSARDLMEWGVQHRMHDGLPATLRQLGCSIEQGRSMYPDAYPAGNFGAEYARIMPSVVRSAGARVLNDVFVIDLLRSGGRVAGAVALDRGTGQLVQIGAGAVIIATGGYQGLYRDTTASAQLTGDGHALALRAGVDVMDFEFNQTLPIALHPPAIAGSTLPFRLLMDWDARLCNAQGERIMARWDPERMEASTRALLSRAIYHEIRQGRGTPHGGVYTSVSHHSPDVLAAKLKKYAAHPVFKALRQAGVDLSKEDIETGYAVHYCQGGCNINHRCQTDLPGLYAIGEAAAGGKDGADRMMSNALPYAVAMGRIAGRCAALHGRRHGIPDPDPSEIERIMLRAESPRDRSRKLETSEATGMLHDIMATHGGYGRTKDGLEQALSALSNLRTAIIPHLKGWPDTDSWTRCLELENLALVAECVVRNALRRKESRGLHDRWDYPEADKGWFRNIHLRLVDDSLQQWTTPVEFTYWRPAPQSNGAPGLEGISVKPYRGWKALPLCSTH